MLLPTRAEVSGTHTYADSDPSEEMPLAARASASKAIPAPVPSNVVVPTTAEVARPAPVTELAPTSNPTPDTPPTITVQNKADKKRSHKKKGRNQYTRDRDAHEDESPARSQSRDIQKDEHGPSGGGSGKASAESSGKTQLKPRGGMSSKVTMTDMRRKAAALLDYISRTQVDLAGEALPGNNNNTDTAGSVNGSSTSGSEVPQNGASGVPALLLEPAADDGPERDFKDLGCMEMMDSLTRRLVKWQQQYAM